MATFTAVGPRLDLDGPRPVAPPHSLLNTPGVVVDSGDGRWLNGAVVYGYPEGCPELWEPCLEGTFRVKAEGSDPSTPTFDPVVLYQAETCSTFGSEFIPDRVEAALRATASAGVEEALVVGTSSNPYFADAGVTILGGAAVTAAVALSWLENAIGGTCRQGMIHAPPSIVSAWNADKVVFQQEGGLYTLNGNRVVSGDGYIGQKPDAAGALPTGSDYAWATGPVEVRLGEIFTAELREALERDTNTVTIRSEQYALATWDTALQVAVLVDWTP